MMKPAIQLLSLLGMLMWGIGVALATPPVQTDTGGEYTVQSGDCLAKIAERFLGSQHYWPAVWRATNMRAMADSRFTLIRNPDLIHSGQIVWLPNATEVELLMSHADPEPDQTVNVGSNGLLVVDVVYYGQWYRDTFHYSKEAPNIRHFAVIMPAARYEANLHLPGHICSSLSFPVDNEPVQLRDGTKEANWDLSVLHPVPAQVELEPGQYYVGGCFIAAPLSREEAGVGDDVILYAGITGGGASSEYQPVTVEPGGRKDITIALSDKDGWACPWVYVFNGTIFERRSEILRNLNSKNLETIQRQPLGLVPVQDGIIRLQIREEKSETTYLDTLYLEVEGIPIWPNVELFQNVDGQYLILRQGDNYELTFDISTLTANNKPIEVVIVAAGYYD